MIAPIVMANHILVMENKGRTDCSCFELAEFKGLELRSGRTRNVAGVIVDGALRGSTAISGVTYPVRARAAHPWPFTPNEVEMADSPSEPFPFGDGAYLVGDGDGLIVMRNADVVRELGL
jgi:regulator of RNase E activity RraA